MITDFLKFQLLITIKLISLITTVTELHYET